MKTPLSSLCALSRSLVVAFAGFVCALALPPAAHAQSTNWTSGTSILTSAYGLTTDNDLIDGATLVVTNGGILTANQLIVSSNHLGTLTLNGSGAVSVSQLLATNVSPYNSFTNSIFNFNAGTALTTSNAANAIASEILLASNVNFSVQGNWTMNGGTNIIYNVATNSLASATVYVGNTVNNVQLAVNSTNAVCWFALPPTNGLTTIPTNTLNLVVGNVGTNDSVVVNNGTLILTNVANGATGFQGGSITIGSASGSGNQLIITNGGQVITKNNSNGSQSGLIQSGTNNGVYVAGTNSAGTKATWTFAGAERFYVGGGSTSNVWVSVGAGGVITNCQFYAFNSYAYVYITNGGQFYTTVFVLGRSGNNCKLNVAGTDANGNPAWLSAGGSFTVGGGTGTPSNPNPGSNCVATVGAGGIVTNANPVSIGLDTNSFLNALVITNGGQFFNSGGSNTIGSVAGCGTNTVYIGGGTGSSRWDLKGTGLCIGSSSAATNNSLTLYAGGMLTNAAVVTLGGVNSELYFNGGTLVAGANGNLIATNTTVNATVDVQAGGAIINDNGFLVTNQLPMTGDPNSTGGGLTKLGGGTLVLATNNTYTGPTIVSAGNLLINNAIMLPSGGLLTLNGGTLFCSASSTVNNPINESAASAVSAASGQVLTLSGQITNAGTLTVAGLGTVVFSGNASTNSASLVLNAGATLAPGGVNTVGNLVLANNLALNGGNLIFSLGSTAGTCSKVIVTNTLSLTNANTIVLNFTNGTAPAGTYTLMTYAANNGPGSLALLGSYPNATLTVGATSVTLNVTGSGTYMDTWKGYQNGTWDTSTLNWTNGQAAIAYTAGDPVTFDDTLVSNSVISGGIQSPGSVTFNNSLTNYIINANLGGTGPFTMNGSATVTLAATNSSAGNTTINGGGTLSVTNGGAINSAGTTAINNGTLSVTSGGAINSPNGTLNIGSLAAGVGTLTLNSGASITVQTLLATNVAYGGVTNSVFNFNGGTLVTSNAANGIAANIVLQSNATFSVKGNWNLNGGTNIFMDVNTNGGAYGGEYVYVGSNVNNQIINVNSNATWIHLMAPTATTSGQSSLSNNLGLAIGAGNSTNNQFIVNGGTLIVTNAIVTPNGGYNTIQIGNAATTINNQLLVTNGGQAVVKVRGDNGGGAIVFAGGNNNSLVVMGTNAAGVSATVNCTQDRILFNSVGVSGTNWVLVGSGGVITNATCMMEGSYASMTVTNGGQYYSASTVVIGRGGNNDSFVVGGTNASGNPALLQGIGGQAITIGGGNAGNPGTNILLRIDGGGLVTNVNQMYVGGGSSADSNCMFCVLIVTNGGQLFSASASYVGDYNDSNTNSVSLGGGTGTSLWNMGNTSLTIGNNALATNNSLTLFSGGVLTNVSAVTLGGVNSTLKFNGGTLVAGGNGTLINTNATMTNGTCLVQAGGANISSSIFAVSNQLALIHDPALGATVDGGLTALGGGTLLLATNNTYTGPTVVSAGNLLVNNAITLPAGGLLTLNGGALSNNASCTLTNTINLNAASTIGVGSGQTLTLTGVMTNGGSLTVAASGTLLINGNAAGATNTWTVANNYATFGGTGTIGGNVVMNAGAGLAPGGIGTVGTLTLTNNLALNGGTLLFTMNNAVTTNSLVAVGNTLSLTNASIIVLSFPNGAIPAGTYTLMTYAATNGPGTLTLLGYPNATLTVGATSVTLTVTGSGTYVDTWKGYQNGTWDTSTKNWTNANPIIAYTDGDSVTFDDTLVGSAIVTNGTVGAVVSPASVTFNNNHTNYAVNANIGGSGALTMNGTATVTLGGTNSYAGNTTVNAGTLVVTNGGGINSPVATLNIGSPTNAGTVTATLAGGAITVQALLATDVQNGAVKSTFNFNGGTLTTSNAANAIASEILVASNTSYTVSGNWNMLGGTNYTCSVQSNAATGGGSWGTVYLGNNATNTVVTVSNAYWSLGNPASWPAVYSNIMELVVGNGSGGTNVLVITNGAQVFAGQFTAYTGGGQGVVVGNTTNSCGNGLIVAGTNGAGQKSWLDAGNTRLYVGQSAGNNVLTSNEWCVVNGGVITNIGGGGLYTMGINNSIVVTNGGQILMNSGVGVTIGREGETNNSLIVAGAGSAGNPSIVTLVSNSTSSIGIGGLSGVGDGLISGTNCGVLVGAGGVISNYSFTVGNDTNSYGNYLIITNGGQVFSYGNHEYIPGSGSYTNANNNYALIGGANGTTNALWNLGSSAYNLYVGDANFASNNTVTLLAGGIVTNLGSVILGGNNSMLVFNGGTLAAGTNGLLIQTNANLTDLYFTNLVQAGGAIINDSGFSISNKLAFVPDPNSTGGGLTKLGGGTLLLATNNTYTGPTIVSAGSLLVNNAITLPGGGLITLNGGALSNNASCTLSNPITVIAASTIGVGSGNVLTLGSSAFTNAAGLTVAGAGTLTLSSGITNNASLTVAGGTLLVNSSFTGTGSLTVAAGGTLLVNGNAAGATNTWTVNSGYLGGTGTIGGLAVLNVDGILLPGAAGTVGTLTLTNNLNLNGGNLAFNLGTNAVPTCSLVAVSQTVNLSNANTIALSFPNGPVPAGTYTLMTMAGTNGPGAIVLGDNYTNVTLNVSATSVQLVVGTGGTTGGISGSPSFTWQGYVDGIWDTITPNWTNASGNNYYANPNAVIFDDTLVGNSTITSSATVLPASVTFSNSLNNYTINASIGGTGSLALWGTAPVALGGNNSFTGGVTVNNGATLVLNTNATLGGASATLGSGLVTVNNATLAATTNFINVLTNTISVTGTATLSAVNGLYINLDGPITNTGSLAVNGVGGGIALYGSNTFAGGVTLTAGTLYFGNNYALGTNTFVINGGALNNNSGISHTNLSATNGISLNASFSFGSASGTTNLDLGPGPATLNTNIVITSSAGVGTNNLIFDGPISLGTNSLAHTGTGGLVLNGAVSGSGALGLTNNAGWLWLSGTNNSYTGQTWLTGGTNFFYSIAKVNGGNSSFGAPTTAANGVIYCGNSVMRYEGTNTCISDRVFNINNGGITLWADQNFGVLWLTGGITNSNNNGITFRSANGSGTGSLNANIIVTGPIITGSGAVTKTDNEYVTITNQQNGFTGYVESSYSAFIVDSLANSNTPSSLGAGPFFILGQVNAGVGTIEYVGPTNTSCNRQIYVENSGNINDGGCLSNMAAGTTITFSGNILLGNGGGGSGGVTNGTQTMLWLNGVGNGVISGIIGGMNAGNSNPQTNKLGVTKSGTGTWTLSGVNTNIGLMAVNAGTLLVTGNSAGTTNTWTVAGGATLGGNGTIGGNVFLNAGGLLVAGGWNTVATLTLTNNLALNGDSLLFNLGSAAGACSVVAVTNTLYLTNDNAIVLNFTNGSAPAGTYTLMTMAGTTGPGSFVLGSSYTNVTLNVSATSVRLVVGAGGTSFASPVTWRGFVNGTWDTSTLNWLTNGVQGNYTSGNAVTFDDTLVSNSVVGSSGTVTPASVTFNNDLTNYIISAVIGGTGTLTLNGAATATLAGANTYASNTIINNGTLVVTNGGSIYSPAATLNIGPTAGAGGTNTLLAGGSITVQSLLNTNISFSFTNSVFNFNGGTLVTSNYNGIAASIMVSSNSNWSINGNWTMNGGTNFFINAATNGNAGGVVYVGNGVNNCQVNVNSNAVWWDTVPSYNQWSTNPATAAGASNILNLVVGNSNATNNVLTVNGGTLIATNLYGQAANCIIIGNSGTSVSNVLVVTNGGQVLTCELRSSGPQAILLGSGGIGNGLYVVGTNSAGGRSMLTTFADRITMGGTSNSWVRVDQDGLITNTTVLMEGFNSGVFITNGGQFFPTYITIGRAANNANVNVGGADSSGNPATLGGFSFGDHLAIGGGYPNEGAGTAPNGGSYCALWVGAGGLVTNVEGVCVGGGQYNDSNSVFNVCIITNGGQVFMTSGGGNSIIGYTTNCNNNALSLGGGTGTSLFNLGGNQLIIGNIVNAMSNSATLFSGGLLTNISSIVFAGSNSTLYFNGGTLAASASGNLITTNATAVNPTNYISAGGAVINPNGNTATIVLPFSSNPNNTGGGLTELGGGTLVLASNNTYTGATVVSAGNLLINNAITLPGGGQLTLNGGALSNNASCTLNNPINVSAVSSIGVGSGQVLTLSGLITNTAGLNVAGAGTLLVNGSASAGAGLWTVNSGTFGGTGTIAGNVQINAGASLAPAGIGNIGTLTLNNNLGLTGNTLYYSFNTNVVGTNSLVTVAGALNLTNANYVNLSLNASEVPAGNYTLMTFAGHAGPGSFALAGALAYAPNVSLQLNANSLVLQVGAGGQNVDTWKGYVSGAWNSSALNWTNVNPIIAYADGDVVLFDDTLAANSVISGGPVSPASVTFNNNNTNYLINATMAGNGPLTLNGTATVTLAGANTYNSNTIINAGTLVVTNGGAIYSPTGTLNIGANGGTGTGTLLASGSITVQTLLATNVSSSAGATASSTFNFNGGTLTTSNNNALAADILLASNANWTINGNWTMNGGTNIVLNVNTNGSIGNSTIYVGNTVNNAQVLVNPNAVLLLACPTNNTVTNTSGIVVGNGTVANNLFVVNGGTVIATNVAAIGGTVNSATTFNIGNSTTATGNQMLITNGGQVITHGFNSGTGLAINNGTNNGVYVGGTNSAGQKSTWTFLGGGGERLYLGNGASSNNWVAVNSGGVMTNMAFFGYDSYSSVYITNGGQLYAASFVIGRIGLNNNLVVAGADGTGTPATLTLITNGNTATLTIGGGTATVSSPNPGTNTVARVDAGGIITNANSITVGQDTNSVNNTLVITNGGQVYISAGSVGNYIGYVGGCNSNSVTVGGGVGTSLWNFNGHSVTIGATLGGAAVATNNTLTLFSGGVVTNVLAVDMSGSGSLLNFNGGMLAAGASGNLITNAPGAVNATNYVQAGGAIINDSGFTVTNQLAMLQDPNSTGGGLTKQGSGTLALLGVNTYTGNTIVSAGTLALSGSASVANSPSIVLAGGTKLDVSGLSSGFSLGGSQVLSNSSSTAAINCGANGLSTASGTVSVTYAAGTPSLTVTNGTLTLSSSTVFNVNNTGATLTPGSYKIISKQTGGTAGSVAGSLPSVTVTGGQPSAGTPTLSIVSGELWLTVGGTSTWSYSGASFTYNGTAQGPAISLSGSTGAATTNYVGLSVSYGPGANAPTNAGTYYVTNTVLADNNYFGATNSQNFTINQTNLTITAQYNIKPYDTTTSATNVPVIGPGSLQAGDTATLSEAYSDPSVGTGKTLIPSVVSIINAGGANVTADYNVIPVDNNTGVINALVTAFDLFSSAQTNGYLAPVFFIATNLPGSAATNVVFWTNGVPFSTNAVAGGGATSLTITNLPRSYNFTNVITAIYLGDSLNGPGTNTLVETITNHPPVASTLLVSRTALETWHISLTDLATNWTDADGDTVTLVSPAPLQAFYTTNNVAVTNNGTWLLYYYTPSSPDLNDQIVYTISDGFGGTNTGYVEVVVNPFTSGQPITGQQTTNSPTGAFTVIYYGIPTYTYVLQRSTNLVFGPGWQSIFTNTVGSGGSVTNVDTFIDLYPLGGWPSEAYYRVGWQP